MNSSPKVLTPPVVVAVSGAAVPGALQVPAASRYAVQGQSAVLRRLAAARHAFEDRQMLRELGLLDR